MRNWMFRYVRLRDETEQPPIVEEINLSQDSNSVDFERLIVLFVYVLLFILLISFGSYLVMLFMGIGQAEKAREVFQLVLAALTGYLLGTNKRKPGRE